MDSLTQIVLGAAVGEAVCGKKIGNKAMIWGAIAGTMPDLDVLINPWLGVVEELSWHRSLTHSIFFALLASPFLALLVSKTGKNRSVTFRDWLLLFFLCLTTHSLLDCFTTWGTQIFWPFNREGIAFYNIFVIDPFYTLPFLFFLIWAATKRKENPLRKKLNFYGLAISSAYIIFTFVSKNLADRAFEQSLRNKGIEWEEYISKPTPFNAILWAVSVKTNDGFYNGFYSLFDKDKNIEYHFFPQNKEYLTDLLPHPKLERLLEITKGYYIVEKPSKDSLIIHDLRFGQFNGWQEKGGEFVFSYSVKDDGHDLHFGQKEFGYRPEEGYFNAYFSRIAGKK